MQASGQFHRQGGGIPVHGALIAVECSLSTASLFSLSGTPGTALSNKLRWALFPYGARNIEPLQVDVVHLQHSQADNEEMRREFCTAYFLNERVLRSLNSETRQSHRQLLEGDISPTHGATDQRLNVGFEYGKRLRLPDGRGIGFHTDRSEISVPHRDLAAPGGLDVTITSHSPLFEAIVPTRHKQQKEIVSC